MKCFLVVAVLATASGCKAETADNPLQAWERLRAAARADDPAAAVACFSEGSREKELADNKLLVTMAPKSLPPALAAQMKEVKERVDGLLEKAKAAPDSENSKRRIAGLESLKARAAEQK